MYFNSCLPGIIVVVSGLDPTICSDIEELRRAGPDLVLFLFTSS